MSLVCVTCGCTSRAQFGHGRLTILQPDFGQSRHCSLVPGSAGGAQPTPRRTSHYGHMPWAVDRVRSNMVSEWGSAPRATTNPLLITAMPNAQRSVIRFLRFHRVAGIPRPLSRGDRTCAPCAMHWTSIRTGSLMGLHLSRTLPLRKSPHLASFMLLPTDTCSS